MAKTATVLHDDLELHHLTLEGISTTTIYAHLTTRRRREDIARFLKGGAS